MSNKRILPAVVLAGTVGFLGLHRIYAGRYVTALIQAVIFGVGAAMAWKDVASLRAMESFEDIMDWTQTHTVQPLPWVLIMVSCTWAIIDCGILLRRKFRDGSGNVMTRWI